MKKADHQSDRRGVDQFQQIVNVGRAMEEDFRRLGLTAPGDLIGQDPAELYQRICSLDGVFHDPCVLDCYWAAVDYMNGQPPRVWWDYTSERKRKYGELVDQLRERYPRT